jgi:hypothetical protein
MHCKNCPNQTCPFQYHYQLSSAAGFRPRSLLNSLDLFSSSLWWRSFKVPKWLFLLINVGSFHCLRSTFLLSATQLFHCRKRVEIALARVIHQNRTVSSPRNNKSEATLALVEGGALLVLSRIEIKSSPQSMPV